MLSISVRAYILTHRLPNIFNIAADHVDDPLPQVDIDSLVEARSHSVSSNENTQTISVDVMTITGTTATAVSREPNVFYDTEVLAIIHRSKSKSSGLVATTVWGWRGKKCHFGEREERKLQDLSKRYGTSIVCVLPTLVNS
jgi:hypothetical protein